MNGFRNWFSRFMMGRYGSDELNRLLLIIAAVLIIIEMFAARRILNLIVIVILCVVYGRMLSRNIGKRQQENFRYLQLKEKVTGKRGNGGQYGNRRYGNGQYGGGQYGGGQYRSARKEAGFSRRTRKEDAGKRVFICPNCKGALKVPVGAGKILITCPHCGSTFEETV